MNSRKQLLEVLSNELSGTDIICQDEEYGDLIALENALQIVEDTISSVMIDEEIRAEVSISELRDNWDKIKRLTGYWQDGSDLKLKMYQDECTKTYHIKIEESDYWGYSFDEALEKAWMDRPNVW